MFILKVKNEYFAVYIAACGYTCAVGALAFACQNV